MIFEVLMAVKMSILVFWAGTHGLEDRYQRFIGTYFRSEDGGKVILRKVGICLQIHTPLQLSRLTWTGLELLHVLDSLHRN
jgi:hypothetical protein